MKTLNQVKVGETVKVTKIAGEGPIKRRIMDMGITKGVEIYVRKVAPLEIRLKLQFVIMSCLFVRQMQRLSK